MRAFSHNKASPGNSAISIGDKNNTLNDFLVNNFSKKLLEHKKGATFEFTKLEIFIDDSYRRDAIIQNPMDLITKCNFIPIRNIMWGEVVVGYLSLNSRHLNNERESFKMMNMGLILDLLKNSLEPLTLQLFKDSKEVLITNPWITYIIEADFKHPAFSEGELDFILQVDLAAMVVALGLKNFKRR